MNNFGQVEPAPGYWVMNYYIEQMGLEGFANYIKQSELGQVQVIVDPDMPKAIALFKSMYPQQLTSSSTSDISLSGFGSSTIGIIALVGMGLFFMFGRKKKGKK